jgi:hypothetical protein
MLRPAGDAGWQHQSFPGKKAVLFAAAARTAATRSPPPPIPPPAPCATRCASSPPTSASLRFSWKVPQLIADADMALREADDSPVRVMLAFEGDRSRFSPRDALLSELMRTLTGEEMPYATLMYVWCNKRAPGTVIRSPRTDRIRKLVLESGPASSTAGSTTSATSAPTTSARSASARRPGRHRHHDRQRQHAVARQGLVRPGALRRPASGQLS